MAGKSSKGRSRKGTSNHNSNNGSITNGNVNNNTVSNDVSNSLKHVPAKDNNAAIANSENENGKPDSIAAETESAFSSNPQNVKEEETHNSEAQLMQGEDNLYAVPVKTLTGEKLEVHLNPGDSIIDVRQFLLDSPEMGFVTCYDLILHTKDGSSHHLEDYNELSDVADITTGGCSLEVVPAMYDDRSIRAHVHRTRDVFSLSNVRASFSSVIAKQNETLQNRAANSRVSDSSKTEVRDLDGLGFMEDPSGSLGNLLPSPLKDVKCVESIVFSSFNPPPSYRRLVGDLIYLDVVTLEGNAFCITGTTRVFYVNSSTANNFDWKPSKATWEATTLIALLQKISPKFKKAFREILDRRRAYHHPFENLQSLLPPNSWLGLYPVPDHTRDPARAENSLTLLYGSEPMGMQRDWNEELQSCREFPHTTLQERMIRDRARYKVTSDFVDAATNGAIGVINGCIPPINPSDPECFHMYVHNNIFFSFAVDADLEQLSKKSTDSNSNIQSTDIRQDSENVSDSQVPSGGKSNGSSSEDLNNGVEAAQEISPEAQLAESEQATYASANNDLKGTIAYQEADVDGLYNLAMAIIDYRGHRVVAQSVLPGILQGDKSESLKYGSVDNGKKICWNEDFHSKVSEAAKCLHLKEHSVLDGSGNAFKLAAPVECKGIVGGDDRHYILDLLRVTPRDANYTGPGSRFCILRSELIAAFCQAQASEKSKSKETNSEGADNLATNFQNEADADNKELTNEKTTENAEEVSSASAGGYDNCDEIVFNPNVFTEFKLAGSPEEIAADEDNVRKVGQYLTDVVIPNIIQDLWQLDVTPMDGQSLTETLHARGINVRYIGKVADGTKHLPHMWDLCTNEIVVRSSKHIIKDVLRDTEDHDLAPALSHLLNCIFGSCQAPAGKPDSNGIQSRTPKKEQQSAGKNSRGRARWKSKGGSRKSQPLYTKISSESLWSDIQEFAMSKYKFELPEDSRSRVKKICVIRNLCRKVGITVASRKYDLNSTTPFQPSDILDLCPVVRHSVPVCSDAKKLTDAAKSHMSAGSLNEAYDLFTEAFKILQQVTGPMHCEVATCCRYLAMITYHAGEMDVAVAQQQRELIINETCLGLDHPDTAHSYANMALYYHGWEKTEFALPYMTRALLLLSLSSGSDHPDVAATFVNVAMMYKELKKMNISLRYLQEALKKNERLLGEKHIQTAVCYHALAIIFNSMGAFKLSLQHEKKTFEILVKQLGEDDPKTQESLNWINTFKIRELQARPEFVQAFQAVTDGGSGSSGAPTNKSVNAAMIAETLPRGRGVDERAARAAAIARKKAAARGLVVRSQVQVQVQSHPPPLTPLFNIINSGVAPDVLGNGDVNGVKKNGVRSSDPADATKDQSVPTQKQEQTPAGLGKGLASLDAKKQKSKPKPKVEA
ncbi:clustered mitochondria protein isoform X1 [Arachis hypogaea]|uniref:clustered mitochondria protein isoform X1 n=1 Tax=Arachis hypogaea TaxID=3818 RepID=UPI000DED6790|nr:clustered mitochondria protein isoform X1 [Arachis hypogaea]QHN97717.1 Clustered mitochondria protein [Arachis hypogaea]